MIIDLAGSTTKVAIHQDFERQLGFPDFYGANWDAFWDAITGLVEMPDEVLLVNWQGFAKSCPKDMQILRDIISEYHALLPAKRILFLGD